MVDPARRSGGTERRRLSRWLRIPFKAIKKFQNYNRLNGKRCRTIGAPLPRAYHVGSPPNLRPAYVIGRAQGGLTERIWTDGGYPVGATDEYAAVATVDAHAFIFAVAGDSMFPQFMPGEYVLIEPETTPQIEREVLGRLVTGETMLKPLLSRRDGRVRLGSWNGPVVYTSSKNKSCGFTSRAQRRPKKSSRGSEPHWRYGGGANNIREIPVIGITANAHEAHKNIGDACRAPRLGV